MLSWIRPLGPPMNFAIQLLRPVSCCGNFEEGGADTSKGSNLVKFKQAERDGRFRAVSRRISALRLPRRDPDLGLIPMPESMYMAFTDSRYASDGMRAFFLLLYDPVQGSR